MFDIFLSWIRFLHLRNKRPHQTKYYIITRKRTSFNFKGQKPSPKYMTGPHDVLMV